MASQLLEVMSKERKAPEAAQPDPEPVPAPQPRAKSKKSARAGKKIKDTKSSKQIKSPKEDGGKAALKAKAPKEKKRPRRSRIKFQGSLSREEAVAYFEAIVAGLKKGSVQFKQGKESLEMSPPDHLEVEVRAARRGSKQAVSFELSWRGGTGSDLTISPG